MFNPEEISSMVLVKMKETAEAYLGKVTYDLDIVEEMIGENTQRSLHVNILCDIFWNCCICTSL